MRFLLPLAAFASLALLGACSDDDTGTSSGSSGSTNNQGLPNPKFATDVMPILVNNCALSSCHASKEAPAGVHITPDADATYAALLKPSTRFVGTKIVVPGKPADSLLVRKLDNTQDQLDNCPKDTNGNPDCGASMPPPENEGATGNEELLTIKSRDTIRNWVRNGAQKD